MAKLKDLASNILQKALDSLNADNHKDHSSNLQTTNNAELIGQEQPNPEGGFTIKELQESLLKSFMPEYLYRPPFGYPRKDNPVALKQLALNPYVFSVNKAIQEEVCNMPWDIVPKEDYKDKASIDGEPDKDEHNQATELDDMDRQRLVDFLNNPNINDENLSDLMRMAINDIVRFDSGVWIKVFNKKGQLRELYARDGSSFLKNTTVFGTFHGRAGIVIPMSEFWDKANAEGVQQDHPALTRNYATFYAQQAGYFQYGQNYQTFPVPFGTREVVYMSMNPQSDSIYGKSPLSILYDTILTLVYGGKYNQDFYLQNNMPEGIISLQGASPEEVKKTKAQWEANIKKKDEFGLMRKQFFKMLFSAGPADFIPFNMKPADMQILEQQRYFHRLLMMCFGMSENELGVVEDVNRANGEVQFKITNRRALLPYLRKIEHAINTQILSEFDYAEGWEFKFTLFDLEEAHKKHDLYLKQKSLGIKTSEMIAEEEDIDIEKLRASKEKEQQEAIENAQQFQEEAESEQSPGEYSEEEQEMPNDEQQQGNYDSKSMETKSEVEDEDSLNPLIAAVNQTYKYLDNKLSQLDQEQKL